MKAQYRQLQKLYFSFSNKIVVPVLFIFYYAWYATVSGIIEDNQYRFL